VVALKPTVCSARPVVVAKQAIDAQEFGPDVPPWSASLSIVHLKTLEGFNGIVS
jgi:hypothetical protein